jgi:WD40 repeat protein
MANARVLDSVSGGEFLVRHPVLSDWVLGLAVSPTGQYLATGGLLGTVFIWDLLTKSLVSGFSPRSDPEYLEGITCLSFHPNLPFFAYLSSEGTIEVLNSNSWVPVGKFPASDDYLLVFAFSPTRNSLAIGRQSGHISVWDGIKESVLCKVGSVPMSLSYSYDSLYLSIRCDDGTCRIFSAATGQKVCDVHQILGEIAGGSFSPCGPNFLAVSAHGRFSILDSNTFQKAFDKPSSLSDIYAYAFCGSTLSCAARSSSGLICHWDSMTNTDVIIQTPKDKITPICYNADGSSLLIGGVDCCVRWVRLFSSTVANDVTEE